MSLRRTKIVATLGPSTEGRLDELISAGVDCARLNCSHSSRKDLVRLSADVRAAAARSDRCVALLFDLQGPKIRLDAGTDQRELVVGELVQLASSDVTADGPNLLRVAYDDFVSLVTSRSDIVIGDGSPRLRFVSTEGAVVNAVVVEPGTVGPRKGVNVTHAQPVSPAITEKDMEDARTAAECDADFVALSFVRGPADVVALRALLAELGSTARVIAKIEKVEAFENLEAIISVSDGVMVARGDYGVEAGIASVPAMQKETIRRAVEDGKLVITATQMLESMISAASPTRAEAADVFNAVMDGTSAVMLSAETSVGAFPVEAVRMMTEITLIAEQQDSIYFTAHEHRGPNPDEAVMRAAVALGKDVKAAALIVPTARGGTARACAKYRPRRPIFALCHDRRVARQLALDWGVVPSFFAVTSDTDTLIDEALKAVRSVGALAQGATVVVTAGPSVGHSGTTNLITLRQLP